MRSPSRREFLSSTSLACMGVSVPKAARTASAFQSPLDRVQVAVIGFNGMGHAHLNNLVGREDVEVTHLCDIDSAVLARGAETVKNGTGKTPTGTYEFLEVVENKSIDAVIIATPHHWHCPIAIRAIQAGKDVYVEKPASHVFREGQLLIKAAKKYGRIIQHGTQMRSSEVTQAAGEVLQSGILGEVKMSKAWNVQRQKELRPQADEPMPRGVNYDRWLGPARKRTFNRNRFHRTWRAFREYGNGDLGDDGIHDVDMARWGLGVTAHPVRITAHGSRIGFRGDREFPDNMLINYQYADNKVLIYEDRLWTPYGQHGFDSGNAFYGTEGYMIFSRRGYFQVYLGKDERKGPGMGQRGRVGQPLPAHLDNFISCVRSRKPTRASEDVAHLSCALVHLGEIAFRRESVLHFNPATERFDGDDKANQMLTKEYRQPWDIPDLG